MEKSLNELFKSNYIKKLYELLLSEIYDSDEDAAINIAQFDGYFDAEIVPTLLSCGGIMAKNDKGIIYEEFEYRNFSNTNPEYYQSINFENTIREYFGIADEHYIEADHPNYISYLRPDASITTNFFEAESNILDIDHYVSGENSRER